MLTWQQLRALGRLLAPTGLQLIAAIVPLGVYIVNDQGSELLSMLGEDLAGGTLAGWARPGWFMFANFLAGTAIWWTARVVLDLRFDAENPGSLLPQEVRDPVLLWWPRILAVLPVLIIAIALFVKTAQYKTSGSVDYKNKLIELGVANVVLAVAMMALFTIRRKVFPKLHAPGAGFRSLKTLAVYFVLFCSAVFTILAFLGDLIGIFFGYSFDLTRPLWGFFVEQSDNQLVLGSRTMVRNSSRNRLYWNFGGYPTTIQGPAGLEK
jgi:hypothetical protein